MTPDIIQWIMGQVGTAGIAALALFMLNRSWETQLAREKTTQEEMTEQRKTLAEVVKANTVAMGDLGNLSRESIASSREMIREMHTVLVSVKRAKKAE